MPRSSPISLVTAVLWVLTLLWPGVLPAQEAAAVDALIDLNGYFPMQTVNSADDWPARKAEIRDRILISQGLWPLPTKADLDTVVHGRIQRDGYVVDRVFFESLPGHFVTGNLYRPEEISGQVPFILCPHGHWADGRFYDAGVDGAAKLVAGGGETSVTRARNHIQSRCVQLARMGCMAFAYDTTGNADSVQLKHRPDHWRHLDTPADWGFFSVQADLRLQNMMGLQTWNSIRAVDFALTLPETDPQRIGVTGASGGGTQSMIVAAVDPRIAAAMPCVMVSTAMQGGCTCENAPLLRVGQGNVDIAAAIAPRPLGLTAADDWTVQLRTKGYPDLQHLYQTLAAGDRLSAVFHTNYTHNYNEINRSAMYSFFNTHFNLSHSEPIHEGDYDPIWRDEGTVWTDAHPAPSGDAVGDEHEKRILQIATADSDREFDRLADNPNEFQTIIGRAWQVILSPGESLKDELSVTIESESTPYEVKVQTCVLAAGKDASPVRCTVLTPPGVSQRTVVYSTDIAFQASLGAAESNSQSSAPINDVIRGLLDSGCRVVAPVLRDEGVKSQTMVPVRGDADGWRGFSGYTYGYNHSLFVRRVQDLIRIVRFAGQESETVDLLGIGREAGPIVLAARSQLGDSANKTVVFCDDFQFQSLERHDDPMFVPGAVKYGDLAGLLQLCAGLIATSADSKAAAVAAIQ